jgi:Zinc finger, C2H2 type
MEVRRFCPKSFSGRQNLWCHRDRFHQKSARKRNQCHLCPRKFGYKENLRLHLRSEHQQIEETKFGCRLCKKKFSFECGFNVHFKRKHSKEKMNGNQIINWKIDSESTKNMRRETKNLFACEFCEKKFASHLSLSEHRDLKHPSTTASVHCCNLCDFSFKYKRSLESHMRWEHSQKT